MKKNAKLLIRREVVKELSKETLKKVVGGDTMGTFSFCVGTNKAGYSAN